MVNKGSDIPTLAIVFANPPMLDEDLCQDSGDDRFLYA